MFCWNSFVSINFDLLSEEKEKKQLDLNLIVDPLIDYCGEKFIRESHKISITISHDQFWTYNSPAELRK